MIHEIDEPREKNERHISILLAMVSPLFFSVTFSIVTLFSSDTNTSLPFQGERGGLQDTLQVNKYIPKIGI